MTESKRRRVWRQLRQTLEQLRKHAPSPFVDKTNQRAASNHSGQHSGSSVIQTHKKRRAVLPDVGKRVFKKATRTRARAPHAPQHWHATRYGTDRSTPAVRRLQANKTRPRPSAAFEPGTGTDPLFVRSDAATEANAGKPNVDAQPITDLVCQFLQSKQWQYTQRRSDAKVAEHERIHHIALGIKNDQRQWGCLFRIHEHTQLLAVYGILPFHIPDSHRAAAMLLTTQINRDLMLGNLDLNLDDGEVRFKTAVDVEVTGLNTSILEHLLQNVSAMTAMAHQLYADLLANADPDASLDKLVSQSRRQAKTAPFYLPTKRRQ